MRLVAHGCLLSHLNIPRTGFHCMTWLSEPSRTWGLYLCLDISQWVTAPPADLTAVFTVKTLDPCQTLPLVRTMSHAVRTDLALDGCQLLENKTAKFEG